LFVSICNVFDIQNDTDKLTLDYLCTTQLMQLRMAMI